MPTVCASSIARAAMAMLSATILPSSPHMNSILAADAPRSIARCAEQIVSAATMPSGWPGRLPQSWMSVVSA